MISLQWPKKIWFCLGVGVCAFISCVYFKVNVSIWRWLRRFWVADLSTHLFIYFLQNVFNSSLEKIKTWISNFQDNCNMSNVKNRNLSLKRVSSPLCLYVSWQTEMEEERFGSKDWNGPSHLLSLPTSQGWSGCHCIVNRWDSHKKVWQAGLLHTRLNLNGKVRIDTARLWWLQLK